MGKDMDVDEINYKTLRKIQQTEKNSPMLTKIDSDFYNTLSRYLKYLDSRLEKESSSQKQKLLKDEIQNTKKIVTNIYEQREKKILLAAISKARRGNPDLKNLVDAEKILFNSILKMMMQSRREFLNKKSQEGKKTVGSEKESEKQENANSIVRVVQDIPEFIGTDTKKYNLGRDDVVSLPGDMSDTLSKRGVVKEIKE
jgi:DNA replication factor GINS